MLQRDFTEEQQMFRDAYRKFLASEIVPHMEDWRQAGIVDREAFQKAGALTAVDAAKAKLVTSELQVAIADLGDDYVPFNTRNF